MDAVAACGTADPHTISILLGGIRPIGINLIPDTGNLEEAAAFLVASRETGAPFQRVQQLLPGYGLQTGDVAKGMDILAGLIGHCARDSLIPNSAAIYNRRVHIHIHLIKQIVKRIRGKIAGIGFLLADKPCPVLRVIVKDNLGLSDFLLQLLIDLIDPLILHK